MGVRRRSHGALDMAKVMEKLQGLEHGLCMEKNWEHRKEVMGLEHGRGLGEAVMHGVLNMAKGIEKKLWGLKHGGGMEKLCMGSWT